MAELWWGSPILDEAPPSIPWAVADRPLTFGELRARVDGLGDRLVSAGVADGSPVALQVFPSVTYVACLLALWRIGARVILVDHRVPRAEYEPLVAQLRPGWMIRSTEGTAPFLGFAEDVAIAVERMTPGAASPLDGTRACLVQLSSGSTGRPKIISRTAQSVLEELQRHEAMTGMLGPDDRVLILNSISHTMGLITGLLHSLRSGARCLLPTTRRPSDLVRVIREQEATAIFGVPVHFDLLNQAARTAARSDLPTQGLTRAVCGGEVLTTRTHQEFHENFGVRIGQVYGVTEFGLIAGDPLGTLPPPIVGRPVPGARTRIVDGELHVRLEGTPYLDGGGSHAYRDGWLRTYDRVSEDSSTGALSILGRLDSLVVIGGLNVDLNEVCETLCRHPDVEQAVVTHRDVIEAFVESDRPVTPEKLTEWCRMHLSPVKIPKRFVIARTLPRNATGKLLRNPVLIDERLSSGYDTSCQTGAMNR